MVGRPIELEHPHILTVEIIKVHIAQIRVMIRLKHRRTIKMVYIEVGSSPIYNIWYLMGSNAEHS